eukprot:842380-Rhodomonas_salina.1
MVLRPGAELGAMVEELLPFLLLVGSFAVPPCKINFVSENTSALVRFVYGMPCFSRIVARSVSATACAVLSGTERAMLLPGAGGQRTRCAYRQQARHT